MVEIQTQASWRVLLRSPHLPQRRRGTCSGVKVTSPATVREARGDPDYGEPSSIRQSRFQYCSSTIVLELNRKIAQRLKKIIARIVRW